MSTVNYSDYSRPYSAWRIVIQSEETRKTTYLFLARSLEVAIRKAFTIYNSNPDNPPILSVAGVLIELEEKNPSDAQLVWSETKDTNTR